MKGVDLRQAQERVGCDQLRCSRAVAVSGTQQVGDERGDPLNSVGQEDVEGADRSTCITGGKDALDKQLTDAKVNHQMKVYPGVGHAFHNDTGNAYNEAQATQAWKDTLAWFAKNV